MEYPDLWLGLLGDPECYSLYVSLKTICIVTLSSVETELGALQKVCKELVRLKMLVDLLLGLKAVSVDEDMSTRGVEVQVESDAASAIAAVKRAGSTKVRHVRADAQHLPAHCADPPM